MSIHKRFRPCLRDSLGEKTKTAWGINEKPNYTMKLQRTELADNKFVEQENYEETHTDWTNQHNLKQINREQKTKLSISSLLIKIL